MKKYFIEKWGIRKGDDTSNWLKHSMWDTLEEAANKLNSLRESRPERVWRIHHKDPSTPTTDQDQPGRAKQFLSPTPSDNVWEEFVANLRANWIQIGENYEIPQAVPATGTVTFAPMNIGPTYQR